MKKTLLLLLMFCGLGQTVHSQSYVVEYEVKTNLEEQLNKIKDPILREQVAKRLGTIKNYVLLHKENKSIYKEREVDENVKNDGKIALKNEEEFNIKVIKMSDGKNLLYKDLETKKYLQQTSILQKPFLIKDNLQEFGWEKTTDKKIIGGFVCQKARLKDEKKNVVAWYTMSIPIKDGPGKYWGLPGLIVELTDSNQTFSAVSIKKVEDLLLQKPTKGEVVSNTEYIKIRKNRMDALKQTYGRN